MAKYSNGATYREGNDNLNDTQFGHTEHGRPLEMYPRTRPQTHTVEVTKQRKGEKGGKYKMKKRKDKQHGG